MSAGVKRPIQAHTGRQAATLQRSPGVVQPKAAAPPARKPPAAPPAYRPQPAPKVLQRKEACCGAPRHQPPARPQPQPAHAQRRAPAAPPPAYRPQPPAAPQRKPTAVNAHSKASAAVARPAHARANAAARVAQPNAARGAQPKAAKVLQPKAAAGARPPHANAGSRVIQMCVKCGDVFCRHGEKCGFDRTYDGFFSEDDVARHVGPHSQTKGSSKKGEYESEHVFASQALKKSGMKFTYNDEITISTPYDVHRGGVSGGGGGISSTGSSGTSKLWAEHMGNLIDTDMKEAVRMAAVEQVNSYFVNGSLNMETLNAIFQWIDGQVTLGRITSGEAAEIKQSAANHALNRMGHY